MSTAQPLHLSIIQADLAWENPEANRRQLTELVTQQVTETDLIILPEMFATGFTMNPEGLAEEMHGPSMVWMRKLAGQYDCLVIGSLAIRLEEGHFVNRLIAMDAYGMVGHYDKIKRFRMAGEHEMYQAGEDMTIISWRGWRLLPLICYDLRFPDLPHLPVTDEGPAYDMLIYVANWPAARIHHWDALLQARAIENQCYVAACNRVGTDGNGHNYVGHSVVWGPGGKQLAFQADDTCVIETSIEMAPLSTFRRRFPIWQDW